MKKFLIGHILSHFWAIQEAYAYAQLPTLVNMLDGKASEEDFSDKRAAVRSYAYDISAKSSSSTIKNAPSRSIAVITCSGPLMKNDQWCGPEGTAAKVQQLKDASSNPNIIAVIVEMDSPGGTVDGTETFMNAIAETKLVKPVVGFVNGMACSAGYWPLSACSTIILNGKTAMVGSIGTVSSFFDFTTALEKAGVKMHEIYAEAAFSKNLEFREAIKGNYQPMRDNILAPLNNAFVDSIKANRESKLDQKDKRVLSGGTYFGQDAIDAGLADDIGNFEFAIDKAIQLADEQPTASTKPINNQTMKVTFQSTMKSLAAFFGLTPKAEEKTFEKEMTQADWEGINAKLGEVETLSQANAALTETNATLTTANKKATGELATATARVKQLEEENATLKATGEGAGVDPVGEKKESPIVNTTKDDAHLTSFDREAQKQYEESQK